MGKIITETTPLTDNDCFYLVDRKKKQFDFPIHNHEEYEMNLVINCKGCQRVVGDSVETLDYYDLVLVKGGLEHGWLQNGVETEGSIHEITIQWNESIVNHQLLSKTSFAPLKKMTEDLRKGIAFSQETIKSVLPLFEQIIKPQPGFMRYLKLLEIIYTLSMSDDYRTLSTSSFAKMPDTDNSRRISKVKDYIAKHYAEPVRLETLASLVGMTPTAFSRFFKTHTNQTLSDYIIDIRLGHAIRNLIDSSMTSSEICYLCGFNNQSNFNRLFKKKKGCTPMEFREKYLKTKIMI